MNPLDSVGRLRPLTPKEFSEAIGGMRSPRWVCQACRRRMIATIGRGRPYLIPASELARFRPQLSFLEVV